MDFSIILGLVQNLAILISFTLLYDLVWGRSEHFKTWFYKVLLGVGIGIIGIILMLTPWEMMPGLVFDTRSALLVIAGLFFGPVSTIVAVIITATFRIIQGGEGMWMGVLVIVSSASTGLVWKKLFPQWRKGKYILHLLFVSYIAHIFMLLCTLALPRELIIPTLKNILIPTMTLYPFAAVLLGVLLVRRMNYWKIRNELMLSEERNRKFMNAIRDAMFIKDENFKYTFFNTAFQNLVKLKNKEIIGNTDREILEPRIAQICSFSDMRIIEQNDMVVEEDNIDGRIYKIIKFPLNFGNGRIGVGGVMRDVTENRKKSALQLALLNISRTFLENISLHEFLRRSHEELKNVMQVENLFIAIYNEAEDKYSFPYFVDEFDNYEGADLMSLNNTLTDYVRTSAKGHLVRQEDIDEINKEYGLRLLGTDTLIWMGAPLFDLSQKSVIGVVTVQNYHNKDAYNDEDLVTLEIFAAYIGLYYDKLTKIEDLRLAKEQAEESNKLKSAFLANVSHEIRTPMTSIIGFTDILMNEVKDERLKEYLSIICNSTYRLLNTVNDLMDIAKLEAGQVDVRPEKFNLGEVFDTVYSFFSSSFNSEIMLKVAPSAAVDIEVCTDKTKLTQIFINLVSNAQKFTKAGYVEFGFFYEDNLFEDPDHIIFFVKDTGCGIENSELDRIFERFYQVENSFSRSVEGTGLGLSIVKEFVSMLGGKIWVESEVGKGTTFYFTIKLQNPYYSRSNL